LKKLGVIDEIIPEPMGGAHRMPGDAMKAVGEAIARSLNTFAGLSSDDVRSQRREKFLGIGRSL
jgi:acetyl-CoA carboxylase carboxyl transferase subunit alpha